DQHPGLECRRGSGACRRPGPRLCGGRLRGAHPGTAFVGSGQGDQEPDRRLGAACCRRFAASGPGRQDHGRDRRQRAARHQHHGRDLRGLAGTVGRHRTGQPDRHPHGRSHPAECRAGGRSHRRCPRDGRTGPAAYRGGGRVQDRRAGPGRASARIDGRCAGQCTLCRPPGRTCRQQRSATPQHRGHGDSGSHGRPQRLAGVL
ncbi:hypothetical protein XPN_1662, partial [Xanthomonas arboricola pv. pruni MAFF 301427]